jgi:phage baseplate assembly protein W
MPQPAAESILVGEIYDAIEESEPRLEILNISFERDEFKGKTKPLLEVRINA